MHLFVTKAAREAAKARFDATLDATEIAAAIDAAPVLRQGRTATQDLRLLKLGGKEMVVVWVRDDRTVVTVQRWSAKRIASYRMFIALREEAAE